MSMHDDNPLESPGSWAILPSIADMSLTDLEPAQGITLERQATTMWYGVMIYHRPKAVEATRWVAFLGSIWGSGSNIEMVLFDEELEWLIRRVKEIPWFRGTTRPAKSWQPDDRVTGEWEEAPWEETCRTGPTKEEMDKAVQKGLERAREIHEKVEGYEQAAEHMTIERDWHRPVFCGHLLPSGKMCGCTAYYECTCGELHPDESKSSTENHPRFLCEDHIEEEDKPE